MKKAIIPAAGLGTRMLPITKTIPKEMLPIVNKPVIHYILEEAIESGIEEILIVTSKGKESIKNYFSSDSVIKEDYLKKGKNRYINELDQLLSNINIEYIEQVTLNGLGSAVELGSTFIGNDPFAVLLGDTITESANNRPVLGQLIDQFAKYTSSVIGVQKVSQEKISRYGILAGTRVDQSTYKVDRWVEKPSLEESPSNLAIAARYVFTSGIFDCIRNTKPGLNNEVQLTDAMQMLLRTESMYALEFDGTRFDVGTPEDFVKTNNHFSKK